MTMKDIYRWLFCLGILLPSVWMNGQIVNIEKKRMSRDSAGLYGDMFASMALQRNTKNFLSLNTGGHISYQMEKSKLLLIGELGFVKGEGERFSNDGFLHTRYTSRWGKYIFWESFTQMQFNKLTKIENRWLTGTGTRFQLTDYDNALFFFGLLYMYEREVLNDPRTTTHDHRASAYFSFSMIPQETISLYSTTYIQPKLDQWSDYRLLTENTLNLGITDKLSFTVRLRMTYDSVPPPGVPTLIYDLHNGLTYTFE